VWVAVTIAGWLGFVWFRLWQATQAPTLVWQDSKSYEGVAGNALWSLHFWAGQRPPLVPLVWKLTGSESAFVLDQTLFAVVAWGLLAWVVARSAPSGWRRTIAAGAVLAFATSPPIVIWDRSVLSESLSLSLGALLFATAIPVARRPTPWRVAALAVTAVLIALTRDSQVWTVGLLGISFAAVAIFHFVRRRRLPRYSGSLALAFLLVAGVAAWGVLDSGRTRANVTDVMFARVFPFPDRVAWFAAHGMPERSEIDRLAKTEPTTKGLAKTVAFDGRDPKFARLKHWIDGDGQSTYYVWLSTHPLYVVSEPLHRPERAFNNAHGNVYNYGGPKRVDSPVGQVLWPGWVWLIPMFAVGLAAWLGEAGSETSWRRELHVVAVLGGVGVLAMLVAWHGDGQETTRHTIEGFAELRLAILVLLVIAVAGQHVALPKRGQALIARIQTAARAERMLGDLEKAWRRDRDTAERARGASPEELERLVQGRVDDAVSHLRARHRAVDSEDGSSAVRRDPTGFHEVLADEAEFRARVERRAERFYRRFRGRVR